MINESTQSPPHTMDEAINKALIITMPRARVLAITRTLAMAMAMAVTMTPAQARTSVLTRGAPLAVAQQRDIGASAAAAAAGSASGGQVLGVKRQNSGQGVIYIVKVLLPGGRVRSVSVDGQSGQVR
jgi:putative hemolysin